MHYIVLIVLLIVASFNFNLPLLAEWKYVNISSRPYTKGKRVFDFLVIQWGGRLVVTAIVSYAFHRLVFPLDGEYSPRKFLLVAFIAVCNYFWTKYEIERDREKYESEVNKSYDGV